MCGCLRPYGLWTTLLMSPSRCWGTTLHPACLATLAHARSSGVARLARSPVRGRPGGLPARLGSPVACAGKSPVGVAGADGEMHGTAPA
eukprot:3697328-Pyramimonas_sp.AAC.1